jgi:hypothetical protein
MNGRAVCLHQAFILIIQIRRSQTPPQSSTLPKRTCLERKSPDFKPKAARLSQFSGVLAENPAKRKRNGNRIKNP